MADKIIIKATSPVNKTVVKAEKNIFRLKNTGGPTGAQGVKGDKGDKGDTGAQGVQGVRGEQGEAATIHVGSTVTLPAGLQATVVNSGTEHEAVLDFGIPRGEKGEQGERGLQGEQGIRGEKGVQGEKGDAATITVGSVSTSAAGTQASITNSGTSSAAIFDFVVPKGDKGEQGVQGEKGEQGDKGDAATIAVGTVKTGATGESASVTNSGTSSAAVFDFVIPRGEKGEQGEKGAQGDIGKTGAQGEAGAAATVQVGTVKTGAAGSQVIVTNSGTTSAAILDFTIPRGDKGEAGQGAGDMLASEYDPTGVVQNAGGIADYVAGHSTSITKTSELTNDGADGTSTYVEADELATVAKSGSYNDLSNKPTIPTVNNAKLTIQKNGSTVKTFTANASTDVTANITVPTKVSELTNDSSYAKSGDLATVATSGSYNDLSNKPTIPTVNNATLTIQKNGTSVGTFTANASTNATANITVPTKVSELTNDSSYAKTTDLAAVATSGSYSDLSNKPTIPAAQVNSDWNATSGLAQILNKPTIPSATSDLENDSDFTTNAAVQAEMATKQDSLTAGDHIDITSNTIKATGYVASDEVVATSETTAVVTNSMIADGTITAAKTATGEFLKLTLSSSDIGEGATLADNTLYGVYT